MIENRFKGAINTMAEKSGWNRLTRTQKVISAVAAATTLAAGTVGCGVIVTAENGRKETATPVVSPTIPSTEPPTSPVVETQEPIATADAWRDSLVKDFDVLAFGGSGLNTLPVAPDDEVTVLVQKIREVYGPEVKVTIPMSPTLTNGANAGVVEYDGDGDRTFYEPVVAPNSVQFEGEGWSLVEGSNPKFSIYENSEGDRIAVSFMATMGQAGNEADDMKAMAIVDSRLGFQVAFVDLEGNPVVDASFNYHLPYRLNPGETVVVVDGSPAIENVDGRVTYKYDPFTSAWQEVEVVEVTPIYEPAVTLKLNGIANGVPVAFEVGLMGEMVGREKEPITGVEIARSDANDAFADLVQRMFWRAYVADDPTLRSALSFDEYLALVKQGEGGLMVPVIDESKTRRIDDRTVEEIKLVDIVDGQMVPIPHRVLFADRGLPVEVNSLEEFAFVRNREGGITIVGRIPSTRLEELSQYPGISENARIRAKNFLVCSRMAALLGFLSAEDEVLLAGAWSLDDPYSEPQDVHDVRVAFTGRMNNDDPDLVEPFLEITQ